MMCRLPGLEIVVFSFGGSEKCHCVTVTSVTVWSLPPLCKQILMLKV